MTAVSLPLRVFANPRVAAHGWYWALPARDLAAGAKREVTVCGKKVLLYRTQLGEVRAVAPYCPHMGAHLQSGAVENDGIRCGFHGWKFDARGTLVDAPCRKAGVPEGVHLETFRVAEKFGMIWLHTDAASTHGLPAFTAFEDSGEGGLHVRVDAPETRRCHPTLILGGGVDEEHFLFVHAKTTAASGPLSFRTERLSPAVIRFQNQAPLSAPGIRGRAMRALYGAVMRYEVTYWNASTALAVLGPRWLPLYSIFAYRPGVNGGTEGLNIYVTPRRRGFGRLVSWFALAATRAILRSGGKEDAVIQNRIAFAPGAFTFENPPFAAFVRYVEEQPHFALGGGP